MMGYTAAASSSVGMGVSLRMMTAKYTAKLSGKKLFFLNFLVSATSSAVANFVNSLCMRYPEIAKGITVFSDAELKHSAGVSNKAAESAVYQTATSRMAMSVMCMGIPTIAILLLGGLGVSPKGKITKMGFEVFMISGGLYIGLPISIAVFPSLSVKKGTDLEPAFHKHDNIYFNKGL